MHGNILASLAADGGMWSKRHRRRTLGKLCDDAKFLVGLEGVQHLDNILMAQPTEDLNLLPQAHYVFLALAMLQDELHGHSLARPCSSTFIHLLEYA